MLLLENFSYTVQEIIGAACIKDDVEVVFNCKTPHDAHRLRSYYLSQVPQSSLAYPDNSIDKSNMKLNGITVRIEVANGD